MFVFMLVFDEMLRQGIEERGLVAVTHCFSDGMKHVVENGGVL